MTTPLTRLAALLLALALGAAACSSGDDEAEASAAPTSDASAAETASDDNGSFLDLSAPTADGSTIELSDFAGQDLMLWFWAPW